MRLGGSASLTSSGQTPSPPVSFTGCKVISKVNGTTSEGAIIVQQSGPGITLYPVEFRLQLSAAPAQTIALTEASFTRTNPRTAATDRDQDLVKTIDLMPLVKQSLVAEGGGHCTLRLTVLQKTYVPNVSEFFGKKKIKDPATSEVTLRVCVAPQLLPVWVSSVACWSLYVHRKFVNTQRESQGPSSGVIRMALPANPATGLVPADAVAGVPVAVCEPPAEDAEPPVVGVVIPESLVLQASLSLGTQTLRSLKRPPEGSAATGAAASTDAPPGKRARVKSLRAQVQAILARLEDEGADS